MHRFDRPRYFVLGLIVMACAWAMPGHAQDPPIEGQFTVHARTVRPISGSTVNIGMEARNRMLASQTLYGSERAVLTAGTVGKLATGVLRRANGAYGTYVILKGVMDAAGWGINELRNQVIVPGTPRQEIQAGERAWCSIFADGGKRCTVTYQGALSVCNWFLTTRPDYVGGSCRSTGPWDGVSTMNYKIYDAQGRLNQNFNMYAETLPATVFDWGTGTDASNVTDEQIFDLLRSTRPDLFAELLKDENGNVIVTPEVAEALNRFRAAVEAATGTLGEVVTSDPGAVEEGEADATPSEWPKFCAWADVVCQFIEDFKKQPDTENLPLPEREAIIEEQHWSSGLASNGTCPAPETVDFTLMEGSYSFAFEYDPICQLATKMRPVLLTIAALLAVFIVAGLRKAGGAS